MMKDASRISAPGQTRPLQPAAPGEANDWPARIDEVLARRRPYAAWLRDAKSYLRDLRQALEKLEKHRQEMAAEPAFKPHVDGLDFAGLARRTAGQQQRLEDIGRRFERSTLNVAAVGLVNQGKSFLLRTLSGLPHEVIPDRDGKHSQHDPLTGARSTILHESGAEIRGHVTFHAEPELLAMLNEYRVELLKSLGQDSGPPAIPLATPFIGLDDFLRRPLPSEVQDSVEPGRAGALLKQLRKYRHLLLNNPSAVGREPLDNLSKDEIIKFVTQDAAGKDERQTYLYLAVKEVRITCNFPHKGVGKIALIDLPGLGEATLGGPERLWETLRLDADIALFVWRVTPGPSSLVEGSEVIELYDTCYQALRNVLPLDEWGFLVLNHDRTINNLELCEGALQKIRGKESVLRFFRACVCDCSSLGEVHEHVLRPVLDHLAGHIGALDRRVATACAEAIGVLTQDAAAALRQAEEAFGGEIGGWNDREFGRLFRERWDALCLGLNNLALDLKDQANKPDDSFVRQVGDALAKCRDIQLSLNPEELNEEIDKVTSYDLVVVDHLIRMRARISALLRTLDTALDQPLANVKAKVAKVLGMDGGFSRLAPQGQLAALRDRLAPHSPQLREAFDNLIGFQMSARGLIGYKIRTKLQALEPRRSQWEKNPPNVEALAGPLPEPRQQPRIKLTPEKPGATITVRKRNADGGSGGAEAHQFLSQLLGDTLNEIERALSEDYSRPNQVAYAIVADFVDSVVHYRQSEDEWRSVYLNLREHVWTTDYEQQRRQQLLLEAFCAAVARALDLTRQTAISLPAG